jgi:holo-[acyl-carrier protein] synthase
MIRSGVDILEVDRVDQAILRHGDRFFERFFTPQELIDCRGQTPALAARLAAKEAVAKALGTGIGLVGWKDIEVVAGPRREPRLELHGEARRVADAIGLRQWSISLSDTHEHAVAVAVAVGPEG